MPPSRSHIHNTTEAYLDRHSDERERSVAPAIGQGNTSSAAGYPDFGGGGHQPGGFTVPMAFLTLISMTTRSGLARGCLYRWA